jgi:hypothetical protein
MKALTRTACASTAAVIAAGSCGPGIFALEAKYPTEPAGFEPETGLAVFVSEVTDARVFEEESTSASAPVIWDDPQKRPRPQIIGARGDSVRAVSNIYLAEGQDVETIVLHMLKAAFLQAGYDLAESEEDADLVAEAELKTFWVWMTPSGITIRVQSSVQADVTVTGKAGEAKFTVDGYNDSVDASTSPTSYQFSLQEALYGFYENLVARCMGMTITPPEDE